MDSHPDNLAFPWLMHGSYPRESGWECAPQMKQNFQVPGVMAFQTPISDAEAIEGGCDIVGDQLLYTMSELLIYEDGVLLVL